MICWKIMENMSTGSRLRNVLGAIQKSSCHLRLLYFMHYDICWSIGNIISFIFCMYNMIFLPYAVNCSIFIITTHLQLLYLIEMYNFAILKVGSLIVYIILFCDEKIARKWVNNLSLKVHHPKVIIKQFKVGQNES